jgi:membrane-bound lytic murein transglycosylase D
MRTHLSKVLSFTAILIFISNSFVLAQRTDEVRNAEDQINVIINKAEGHFRAALKALEDGLLPQARENFDNAVEVFMLTRLETKKIPRLQNCYDQMLETITRIEIPSNQKPKIQELAATCGWSIDKKSTDLIATLKLPNGFETEQKFEPAAGDELARIELTQEEQQVENNPVAQQQMQYAVYAVANKSLGFSFQVHPMIQQYVNYYQGRGRGTMETGLYRSGMFMRMARRIFREEGIPENIAWLGQVESMWKPTAMSWAAASGLWQFIPGTGARFGLRRTAYVDERNSFEKATKASAQYLKFLANRYGGNWELAMAAYNCGEGNVDRAIARAGVSNYWAAYPYLPRETRNYVPNILATILIANNPQQYGFGQVRPAPQLMYDQIRVPASTNLSLVAQASDASVEFLRYLNPELRTNITPPEPYIIRVPAGKANEVVAIFKRINPSNNTASVANTAKGETWQTISNRTGISVADLMAANGNTPLPGKKVVVPQGNNVQNIVYSRPTTPVVNAPTTPVRMVKAQKDDTVATLAQRNKVSPKEVAQLNGLLINSKLTTGREIRIPIN